MTFKDLTPEPGANPYIRQNDEVKSTKVVIPVKSLIPGHTYRAAVGAYGDKGAASMWSSVDVKVQLDTPQLKNMSASYEKADLPLEWGKVENASYYLIALADVTNSSKKTILSNVKVSGLKYTIPANKLEANHQYKVSIGAYAVSGVGSLWNDKTFSVKSKPAAITYKLNTKAILSAVKGKTSGSAAELYVDVNRLSDLIYKDIEKSLGLEFTTEASMTQAIVDKLTKRVGVSGLQSFADRSNQILNKEWEVLKSQLRSLGYNQQETPGIGYGEKQYFTITCYEANGCEKKDLKFTYKAENLTPSVVNSKQEIDYNVEVYKVNPNWLDSMLYQFSAKTGDPAAVKTLSFTDPGIYYVTVSKSSFTDLISKIKSVITIKS